MNILVIQRTGRHGIWCAIIHSVTFMGHASNVNILRLVHAHPHMSIYGICAQGVQATFLGFFPPSTPSSSWGCFHFSFRRMPGDAGAAREGSVEAIPMAEINAGFDAPMLKVIDTSRVSDKVLATYST